MELSEIDILSLIPQKPPFVMVDKLVFFDRVFTTTEFEIRPDNLFLEKNKFLEAGIVENIAQTCAVRLGYINTNILNDEVKVGFIGALKNLEIFNLPDLYAKLLTTIEVVSEVFNITLVNATVKCNDELIAKCEMKISIVES
jgi:predicted hotdog family 3-hydroxylacyl-ACP dehydratase